MHRARTAHAPFPTCRLDHPCRPFGWHTRTHPPWCNRVCPFPHVDDMASAGIALKFHELQQAVQARSEEIQARHTPPAGAARPCTCRSTVITVRTVAATASRAVVRVHTACMMQALRDTNARIHAQIESWRGSTARATAQARVLRIQQGLADVTFTAMHSRCEAELAHASAVSAALTADSTAACSAVRARWASVEALAASVSDTVHRVAGMQSGVNRDMAAQVTQKQERILSQKLQLLQLQAELNTLTLTLRTAQEEAAAAASARAAAAESHSLLRVECERLWAQG
ncbi:hypothetical protein EON67_11750, partial [archaeon]